ncbi:MAG: RNA polymerase sigma factor [Chlorobi bacterium]|nr:RNA polymerase sigma factor [Chlorobiota bacterium]
MNEAQLIQECLKGNYRAQKELYNHYSPIMMGICMRYASNEAEAEDILQEGFIKVFRHLHTFRSTGQLGAWICRIMINTALQNYRDTKKMKMQVEYEKVDFFMQADDDILAQLSAEDLMCKIQKLPKGYRMVFNLYAVEGFNHAEIAEELEISVGTSKSQYSRARAMLRKMIEEENKELKIGGRVI